MITLNAVYLRAIIAGGVVAALSGCAHDIEYVYDVPGNSGDCPADTIYRSGGTAIRDRSGGTAIRDRDGGQVSNYCEMQVCPDGTTTPTGEPFMVWHLEGHEVILGRGTCPAT